MSRKYRFLLVLLFSFFCFSPVALADFKLQNYKVKTKRVSKTRYIGVVVEGQISGADSLAFDGEAVTFRYRSKKKRRSRKIRFSSMGESSMIELSDGGNFKFQIEIPKRKGQIRIPVLITNSDGESFSTRLIVSLTKKPYRMILSEKGKKSGKKGKPVDYSSVKKRFATSVGFGANYLKYEQANQNPTTQSAFESILAGSFTFDFRYNFTQEWGVQLGYKSVPGKIQAKSADDINGSGDYSWSSTDLEVMYLSQDSVFELFSKKFVPTLRFGIQMHSLPFLISIEEANKIKIDKVESAAATNLSVGGGFFWQGTWRARYEFFLRYQNLLSKGSKFDLKPGLVFDGSLGFSIPFKSGLRLGVYWFGQMHNYKYVYLASSQASKPTGEQNLFYSKLNLSAGFEF